MKSFWALFADSAKYGLAFSDFDCAFMVVSIENQKKALTSIEIWFTYLKRTPPKVKTLSVIRARPNYDEIQEYQIELAH